MKHLIWVNVFIILMNIALLASEYGEFYYIELTMKLTLYAYKLRLEFKILDQLMRLVKAPDTLSNYRVNTDDNPIHSGDGRIYITISRTLTSARDGAFNSKLAKDAKNEVFSGEPGVIMATTEAKIDSTEALTEEI